MVNILRIFRHLMATRSQVRRAFPEKALLSIEAAISEMEATHDGQIRFAVEHALDIGPLLRGQNAHERAIEVFSMLKVWDTEHNNGVLIYLLWADRGVEIVADRGIHARFGASGWENICREMEACFREGRFEAGIEGGIHAVGSVLQLHFPAMAGPDELSNKPVLF